jgi:transcriptional regulator with XRE-family HTH domain
MSARLELIRWRVEHNVSQESLARMLSKKVGGVNQTIISKWETGGRRPTMEQAFALEEMKITTAKSWVNNA